MAASSATRARTSPLTRPATGETPTQLRPSTWRWTPMWSRRWSGRERRSRAVEQGPAEVVLLQHLAELLGAPVGDEELEAGPVAQAAVPVVAEDRDDADPDLGDLLEADPGAETLREHRVGREAAADPDVEPGSELRVDDTDEGHVVRLVGDVEARRAGDRGLELPRQVGELGGADVTVPDLLQGRRAVDDLVGGDARHGRAEDDARRVAAGLGRHEADGLEALPDRGDVLDADPVELDVLAVGDVGGVAGEVLADPGDGAQLLARERAAVGADPEHEVLVVQLAGVQGGRLAAVDTRPTLRVEAPPAHPAPQVVSGDRGEPVAGVVVDDPLADVEAVVGLLELLVVVQRRPVAVGPRTGRLARLPGRAGGRSPSRSDG